MQFKRFLTFVVVVCNCIYSYELFIGYLVHHTARTHSSLALILFILVWTQPWLVPPVYLQTSLWVEEGILPVLTDNPDQNQVSFFLSCLRSTPHCILPSAHGITFPWSLYLFLVPQLPFLGEVGRMPFSLARLWSREDQSWTVYNPFMLIHSFPIVFFFSLLWKINVYRKVAVVLWAFSFSEPFYSCHQHAGSSTQSTMVCVFYK